MILAVSKIIGSSQMFSALFLNKVKWKIVLRFFSTRQEVKQTKKFHFGLWLIFQLIIKLIFWDFSKKITEFLDISLQITSHKWSWLLTSNKIRVGSGIIEISRSARGNKQEKIFLPKSRSITCYPIFSWSFPMISGTYIERVYFLIPKFWVLFVFVFFLDLKSDYEKNCILLEAVAW